MEYKKFLQFIEEQVEGVNIKALEKEFDFINNDIDIISYTQGKSRYLKFDSRQDIFGLEIDGLDYETMCLVKVNEDKSIKLIEIPLQKDFTSKLRQLVMQSLAQHIKIKK